jgi:hypothetical protein
MSLTILAAKWGRMAKLITPDDIIGYARDDDADDTRRTSKGGPKWFRHFETEVHSIHDLSAVLSSIEDVPHAVVIRGQLLPDVDATGDVLRRKEAWGGHRAYYRMNPAGVTWMMADFDKLPEPEGLHPDDRLSYLVSRLPVEFHEVSHYYQWSSSMGLPSRAGLLSGHLWYCLETPRTDAEMMRWADTQDVDGAVMRTVQPNYTAAPIFQGIADPFAGGARSGFVKRARNAVPDFDIPAEPCMARPRGGGGATSKVERIDLPEWKDAYRWDDTLLARLSEINVRLHMPINKAIACAVTLYGGKLDWPALKRCIVHRIKGSPHGEKHVYLRDSYLDASYRGAVAKFGGRSLAAQMVESYEWRRERRAHC